MGFTASCDRRAEPGDQGEAQERLHTAHQMDDTLSRGCRQGGSVALEGFFKEPLRPALNDFIGDPAVIEQGGWDVFRVECVGLLKLEMTAWVAFHSVPFLGDVAPVSGKEVVAQPEEGPGEVPIYPEIPEWVTEASDGSVALEFTVDEVRSEKVKAVHEVAPATDDLDTLSGVGDTLCVGVEGCVVSAVSLEELKHLYEVQSLGEVGLVPCDEDFGIEREKGFHYLIGGLCCAVTGDNDDLSSVPDALVLEKLLDMPGPERVPTNGVAVEKEVTRHPVWPS